MSKYYLGWNFRSRPRVEIQLMMKHTRPQVQSPASKPHKQCFSSSSELYLHPRLAVRCGVSVCSGSHCMYSSIVCIENTSLSTTYICIHMCVCVHTCAYESISTYFVFMKCLAPFKNLSYNFMHVYNASCISPLVSPLPPTSFAFF